MNNIIRPIHFLIIMLTLSMNTVLTQSIPYKNSEISIDNRVKDLLSRMTIEEKAGQLNLLNGGQFTGPSVNDSSQQVKVEMMRKGLVGAFLNVVGVEETHYLQKIAVEESRLGIPLLFGYDVIHGYKTIFPIPIAEACAWNLELSEKAAEIAAKEASAAGINWTFAPMCDVSREPRWGRVMEGAGEDAWLAGELSAARVRGFQKNISNKTGVMATVKHLAAYGAVESGREYNSVDVSRGALFNYYLPAYKRTLQENPASIMNSFNLLDGIPVSGNHYLNVEILQNKWNFKGFMVSDWNSFGEMIVNGFVEDRRNAAKKALLAGSMMDMVSGVVVEWLPDLVEKGEIPIQLLDSVVYRILHWKFKLGLFDQPYSFGSIERENSEILSPENRKAARIAAQESMVLLKNKKNTLPLNTSKSVLLIGELAENKAHSFDFWVAQGSANSSVSFKEGIEKQFPKLAYSMGYSIEGKNEKDYIKEAVKKAKKADQIVVVLGLSGNLAGEDRSLVNLEIPENQINLVKALKELNKPIIALVQSGRPLILTVLEPLVDAILYTWIPGTEGGNALADLLSGDVNPSAKTVMTFPRSLGQVPIYYNHISTGRPKPEGDASWTSRYRDEENTPLYPFGFGLSYTQFTYSEIQLSKNVINFDEELEVSVIVKNTGTKEGSEIVQLYVKDWFASIVRPIKELKGFKKIFLKKGESQRVSFKIGKDQLGFFTSNGEYIVEQGKFSVSIGESSATERAIDFVLK